MILKSFIFTAIALITMSTHLCGMEVDPADGIIELEQLIKVMEISDYNRERYYPQLFLHFLNELELPQDICLYIFLSINPELPQIRADFLNNVRTYLALSVNEKTDQLWFINSLLNSCSVEVSSVLMGKCLREAKITFEELYKANARTPFHSACYYGDLSSVTVLIGAEGKEAKKLLWIKDHLGNTGPCYTAVFGHAKTLELLIKTAQDDSLKLISTSCDDSSSTLCHAAAHSCNTEILTLLVTTAGKNSWKLFTTKNKKGQTALAGILEQKEEKELYNLLEPSQDFSKFAEEIQKILNFLYSEESGWKPKKKSIKENCVIQ